MEELNMEITIISKARYDQLINSIKNLETHLNAIESNNNQLAEIAFDESKFTDMLLERC